MRLNQKVIVFGMEVLDYFSEKQKKQVQMILLHYYNPCDNMQLREKRGFIPMVAKLPIELLEQVKNGIGLYEFSYALRTFAGKPQLEVIATKYVKSLDLSLGVA